jgi:hypothetical protein
MKNLVYYNEQENILRITFTPEMTVADLQEYYDHSTKVLEDVIERNKKILVLDDLSLFKPRFPKHHERMLIKQNLIRFQPYIEREAIFGLNHFIRGFAIAIFTFVRRDDIKIFKDEISAKAWLKQTPTSNSIDYKTSGKIA